MKTVYITIGNSDDKLRQQEWCRFCRELSDRASYLASETHFIGFSNPDSPWQTMLICIVVPNNAMAELKANLKALASNYGQDSIALAVAEVEFVKP